MHAIVYKSTGSWYAVKNTNGKMLQARIKGKFKIDGISSTNPIAVGDVVDLNPDNEKENTFIIHTIHERKNYINRQSPHNRHQHHIIASNLDQSMLFATIKSPRTSQGFIDRFLIASEAFHIPSIIIFNKADIYEAKDMAQYEDWAAMYRNAGYSVFLISMETGQGVEDVREVLKDKVTLISGHSGVGKSSFINAVLPDLNLRTEEVSDWSGKGMHTTTFAEMFDLPFGGSLIDTPGVKEFGLVDISRQELSHYFPEMRARIQQCHFNNCLHINEPGCAIKKAVNEKSIHMLRYISYCTILDTIDEGGQKAKGKNKK